MGTLYLGTSRTIRNPVRPQEWNASIRAGDDFKLALTVYADDYGTPAQVTSAHAQILLWPDAIGYAHSCDYGLGWLTGGSPISGPAGLLQTIIGFTTPVRPGGINFYLAGAQTQSLCLGRYRLVLQVDLPDGTFTQVEGIVQVRGGWRQSGLVHTPGAFLVTDLGETDIGILAPFVINGIPTDADGFALVPTDNLAPLDQFYLDRNQLA
jgi:hypothetical protein